MNLQEAKEKVQSLKELRESITEYNMPEMLINEATGDHVISSYPEFNLKKLNKISLEMFLSDVSNPKDFEARKSMGTGLPESVDLNVFTKDFTWQFPNAITFDLDYIHGIDFMKKGRFTPAIRQLFESLAAEFSTFRNKSMDKEDTSSKKDFVKKPNPHFNDYMDYMLKKGGKSSDVDSKTAAKFKDAFKDEEQPTSELQKKLKRVFILKYNKKPMFEYDVYLDEHKHSLVTIVIREEWFNKNICKLPEQYTATFWLKQAGVIQ